MQKPMSFVLLMIFLIFSGSGCSFFDKKIENRQFKESRNQKTSAQRSQYEAPLSTDNKIAKKTVRKLEGSLSSRREIEQYAKALPWFQSEKEKVDFLSLPDFESKQSWLNEKEFGSRSKKIQESMQDLVEAQDIAIGMPFNLVRQSWGDPDSIEVSGNPSFKNERWKYNKFISTQDGYKAEKKIVYFEGGKVVGWELE